MSEVYNSHVFRVEPTVMSEDIGDIALALSKAQGEMESAKKDSKGYGYSYSDLATVIESAKPILAKNDLAVVQLVGNTVGGENGSVTVTTILTHKSGQYFKSVASIPLVEMKSCNIAQEAGASLSYLRRYAYQSIIGQPSEDNDASSKGLDKPNTSSSFSKPKDKETPTKEVKTATTASKPNFRKPKASTTKAKGGL